MDKKLKVWLRDHSAIAAVKIAAGNLPVYEGITLDLASKIQAFVFNAVSSAMTKEGL
jgi:hypothetical protein